MLKSICNSLNFKESNFNINNKNLSREGNQFLALNKTEDSFLVNKLPGTLVSNNSIKNLSERLLMQDLLIYKNWPNLEAFGSELNKCSKLDLLNIFPKLSDNFIVDLYSYINFVNEKILLIYFKQNASLYPEIPSQIVNAFYEDLILLDKIKNDTISNTSWLLYHVPIHSGETFYMTNIFCQKNNANIEINKRQRFIIEFKDDYLGEIQIDGLQFFTNNNLEKISMYFRSDGAISDYLKSEIKQILKSNFDNYGVDLDLKIHDLKEIKQDHIKDIIQEFNISL